jgi:hypothetical protein
MLRALAWAILLVAVAGCGGSLNITATSWNVNSVAKIRNDPRALAHISSCDVVFLQETLSTTPESCLLLPGFVGQHSLAIPTNRRPSRGISSFFKIETFVDGALSQVTLFICTPRSKLVSNISIYSTSAGFFQTSNSFILMYDY